MGLIELVTRVGEDNVKVQPMLESITNIRLRNRSRESVVTFVTGSDLLTPADLMNHSVRYRPLVLWIPEERVGKALKEHSDEGAADEASGSASEHGPNNQRELYT
jgi:hypothetical protein